MTGEPLESYAFAQNGLAMLDVRYPDMNHILITARTARPNFTAFDVLRGVWAEGHATVVRSALKSLSKPESSDITDRPNNRY